jgi:hypothetical protein
MADMNLYVILRSSRAILPVDEIIPVADTVLVRPDPEPAEV